VSGNELSEVPVALALRKKKFVSAVARRHGPVNGYHHISWPARDLPQICKKTLDFGGALWP
jgi:hypothetical protein